VRRAVPASAAIAGSPELRERLPVRKKTSLSPFRGEGRGEGRSPTLASLCARTEALHRHPTHAVPSALRASSTPAARQLLASTCEVALELEQRDESPRDMPAPVMRERFVVTPRDPSA